MSGTVLVTGGTGFVGSWCIAELLQRGYVVRTTLRSRSREEGLRAALAAKGLPVERLTVFTADLLADDGWDAAMAGCDYVLHVASPLAGGKAGDRESLVAPARDGTLRVLHAAVKAGVRRVVMTSAAATARPPLSSGRVSDETIWADPEDAQFDAYRVSKIRAEQAAWTFVRQYGGAARLTTILPGAVFGPLLTQDMPGSVGIIDGLLAGRPAAMPRLGFWVVDVRDLVDLHIRAMLAPEAAGERFIAAGEFLWMEEIAAALRAGLGPRAARVPSRRLPGFVVKLLLPFMGELRGLAPLIGRRFALTSDKARRVLGFAPRPAGTTIVDCAESLLARGKAGAA